MSAPSSSPLTVCRRHRSYRRLSPRPHFEVPASTPDGDALVRHIPISELQPNAFSLSVYGEPALECDDLLASITERGILVPLVVTPHNDDPLSFELLSGHRRLTCAQHLGWKTVPCQIRTNVPPGPPREQVVLAYNRQRRKTFSQMMREADSLERHHAEVAQQRRLANLGNLASKADHPDRRNSDDRSGRAISVGRTDVAVARAIGLGGKDAYRQARAVWKAAQTDDPRAKAAVAQLDLGGKTIHAAHKDLRRRDRFTAGFRPTPYDVWPLRHDTAYGIPHPGAIPAGIIAHLLHYYTEPDALVVDPMAGGGTTLDVCLSMGRRCLAFDLAPVRPEIADRDVKNGFTPECGGCDLIFVDPPYHTLRARRYFAQGAGEEPLAAWLAFLEQLARDAFATLRPGGHFALLLANQTEKDLPAGHGYLDHAFFGYQAIRSAGFLPERRISCPMSGAYLPQQIIRARRDGRMLGLVRDLLIGRKPR